MSKSTVFTVLLLLLGMAAYSFGWVQAVAEAAAQYVQIFNNDALRLGLLACIAAVLMLPAFLYLHYVTQSVKNMTAAFQKLTQSHQSCCDFQHHRLCSRYAEEVKSLRDRYKNVRQTYVMAAVLCQVIIFGCMFEIVKAVPFPPSHASYRFNGNGIVTDFVFIVLHANVLAEAFSTWHPVQKNSCMRADRSRDWVDAQFHHK